MARPVEFIILTSVCVDQGRVTYDPQFEAAFNFTGGQFSTRALRDLCRLCQLIGRHSDLVVPGSAQCLPQSKSGH